jgi:hypothetical protein
VKAVESVTDEALALFARNIFVGKRKLEIFEYGEIVDEVIALEDETDIGFVEFVAIFDAEFVDGFAIEKIFAGPGAIEHAENAEQRGFACAAGAHDGDEFAGGDVQGDAAEDEEFAAAGIVGFFEMVETNQRFHESSSKYVRSIIIRIVTR